MIDKATYEAERAICDKANAFWKANATFSKSGWSNMSTELSAHPDYAACDNAMRGRVEQYEVLTNPPEKFVAYVAHDKEQEFPVGCERYHVTTWTGDKLGTCVLGSGWPVRSHLGSRMYQVHATIAGRHYTGRSFGEGMSVLLRETAKSKRNR